MDRWKSVNCSELKFFCENSELQVIMSVNLEEWLPSQSRVAAATACSPGRSSWEMGSDVLRPQDDPQSGILEIRLIPPVA